jgi:hypothetical protein
MPRTALLATGLFIMFALTIESIQTAQAQSSASGSIDGWTLAVRVTIDSGSPRSSHWSTSRVRIAGHLVRTDMDDDRWDAMVRNGFARGTIDDDSAHTSMFFVGDRGEMTRRSTTADESMQYDSSSRFVAGPTISTRDLGRGQPILGHPTRKYAVTLTYAAVANPLGETCKRTMNSVEQLWVATDLPRDEKLSHHLRDAQQVTGIAVGVVDDSLEWLRVQNERGLKGFILRSEITLTKPAPSGGTRTIVATAEVTELSHGILPQSVFASPSGIIQEKLPVPPPRTSADSIAAKARRAGWDDYWRLILRQQVCDPPASADM